MAKQAVLFSGNSVSLYLRIDTQVCGCGAAAAQLETAEHFDAHVHT